MIAMHHTGLLLSAAFTVATPAHWSAPLLGEGVNGISSRASSSVLNHHRLASQRGDTTPTPKKAEIDTAHDTTAPAKDTTTGKLASGEIHAATLVGHCNAGEYDTYILADGGITATGETTNGAAPANGSLGFRHLAADEEFRTMIAVKSANDTLHGTRIRDFANSILAPIPNGSEGSLSGSYRHFNCYGPGQQQGWRATVSIVHTTWAFDTTLAGSGTQSAVRGAPPVSPSLGSLVNGRAGSATSQATVLTASPATIAALTITYSSVWINQIDEKNNLLAFGTELGATWRGYGAEGMSNLDRMRFLGTTAHQFVGGDFAAWIRLHNLTVRSEFPVVWARGGTGRPHWAGFDGARPVITFSLEAPIYTITNTVVNKAPAPTVPDSVKGHRIM